MGVWAGVEVVAEADNAAAAMAGLLMLLLTLLLLRIAAAVAAAWDCASRLALWSSMLGEREKRERTGWNGWNRRDKYTECRYDLYLRSNDRKLYQSRPQIPNLNLIFKSNII